MYRSHWVMLISYLAIAYGGAQAALADLLITGGTVLSGFSNLDDSTLQRTLPMPMRFYDQTYSTVEVSTNGNLNFSANPLFDFPLPESTITGILPLWDDFDLTSDASATITESTSQTYYAVTWNNAHLYGNPGIRHTFQTAWFGGYTSLKGFDFQPDDIAFCYTTLGASFNNGVATVGLQGPSFEQYTSLPGTDLDNGVIADASLLPAGTNQFVLFRPANVGNGTSYAAATLEINPALGGAINILRGDLLLNKSQIVARSISGDGSLTVADADAVLLFGSNTYTGPTIVIDGTLIAGVSDAIPSSTSLNLFDGATFDPNGNAVTVGYVFARGQISLGSGTLSVTGWTEVNEPTTIDLKGGTLSTGSLSGSGRLQFANGTLEISGASGLTIDATGPLGANITLGAGQTLRAQFPANIAAGSIVVLQSGGAFGAPTITNGGELMLDGTTATLGIGGGTLQNFGLVRGEGRIATFSNNNNAGGEIRAEAGKRLRLTGSNGTNAGKINLQGGTAEFNQPLTNGATGQIVGRGTLIVGGTGLTNNGQVALSSGITDVFGKLTNNTGSAAKGVTISGNADVTFWDDVTNTAPSLFKVSTGSSATFFGTVAGSISGTGSKYFEADLSPGAGAAASVDLDGDVYMAPTARLLVDVGGTSLGSYDRVHVGSQLTLDGGLLIAFLPGFTPAAGQSFDILDWGSLSGTFGSVALPALGPNLTWNTSQLYTAGVVSISLPGDFNGNGVVDAADYVLWRKGLGTTYTQSDYNVWRTHFGQSAGSGAGIFSEVAVPEPVTVVLLLPATVVVLARRMRSPMIVDNVF